jgi:hypothetical protein
MVVETLMILGASQTSKWVLENVLDFSSDLGKEYFKDFFKDKIGDQIERFHPEIKAALAEAVGEFIKLFVKELCANDVNYEDINGRYLPKIKQFVKHKELRPFLGKAFDSNSQDYENEDISQIWLKYQPCEVIFPARFDWDLVAKNYRRQVKEIRRKNETLCRILDSELLDDIAISIKSVSEISRDSTSLPTTAFKRWEVRSRSYS